MTRPRKSEHIRKRLLQEGIELFSEHGYHGTGIKMILDTVSVPKGSFYNYFESKEKFAAEIIEAYSDDLIKRFDAYLEMTTDDPVTVIRKVYGIMIQELEAKGLQKGCLLGNLAAEIGGAGRICQDAMKRAFYAWRKRFVKLIIEAQDQKLVRSDINANQLTEIFWNHWEGALLRMKIEGNGTYAKEAINIVLDVLFK